MSTQPPGGQPDIPPAGTIRCPRCSALVGPDQDWCLECGAPARTRLAQTPNWQLPTVAIAAIVLVAGAMLAFAFVRLTDDGDAPAGAVPATTAAPVVPRVVPPPAGATGPSGPTGPAPITPTTGTTPATGTTSTTGTTATTPTTATTATTATTPTATSTTATTPSTTTSKEDARRLKGGSR